MPYTITDAIRKKASAIDVTLKPSKNPTKKLDAYKNGIFQCSFGQLGYKDYQLYLKNDGIEVANDKRRLYRVRHAKDRKIMYRDGKLTAGYLADKILW